MPKSEYDKKREQHIFNDRPIEKKKRKPLNKVSPKRKAKMFIEYVDGKESYMPFFKKMRPAMSGWCGCGCGKKSQKDQHKWYYFCICHIFPKKMFPSVATHELNWVERTFWGGHHTNMDTRSITLWPTYADWDDIRRKFLILEKLLTKQEKAKKFYQNLKALVDDTGN